MFTKKKAMHRLVFGVEPHEASHMGNMGGNEPKRWNSKSLVGSGLFHLDPKTRHFLWGGGNRKKCHKGEEDMFEEGKRAVNECDGKNFGA